jgi:tryptophan synthase alpha chain
MMRLERCRGNVQLAEPQCNMPNNIVQRFNSLAKEKRKAFIPYLCAGDPTFETTIKLALALEQSGADLIELGLPFSDPVADGLVNQLAAQRALAAGASTPGTLDCVKQIRTRSAIPIVLYTYLNPILQFGWTEFHEQAAAAGVDGLLILDLPPEEDPVAWNLDHLNPSTRTSRAMAQNCNEDPIHIRLIAPTTPPERIAAIAKDARGFLYYVSREGVTGAGASVLASLAEQIVRIREASPLPIAVGFGISTPEQAREVAKHADAIVVGSAIVDLIAKHGAGSAEQVSGLARAIAQAIR